MYVYETDTVENQHFISFQQFQSEILKGFQLSMTVATLQFTITWFQRWMSPKVYSDHWFFSFFIILVPHQKAFCKRLRQLRSCLYLVSTKDKTAETFSNGIYGQVKVDLIQKNNFTMESFRELYKTIFPALIIKSRSKLLDKQTLWLLSEKKLIFNLYDEEKTLVTFE